MIMMDYERLNYENKWPKSLNGKYMTREVGCMTEMKIYGKA
jgi:hypothetical protein